MVDGRVLGLRSRGCEPEPHQTLGYVLEKDTLFSA